MIAAPSDIITLGSFSGIRAFSTGTALAAAKYTLLTDVYQTATIISNNANNQIKTDASSDFVTGEAVFIKIGDFSFKHIIANAGDDGNYLLKDMIEDNENNIVESGTCEIKRLATKRVQLSALDEGYYIIEPNNTKLVIRGSYLAPHVSLEEIATVLIDATNLKEYRLEALNKRALTEVYQDLSGFGNYFDIIDEVDLKVLLWYKVQCLLAFDYEETTNTNNKACYMYDNKIMKYAPKEKLAADDSGEIISNIPEPFTSGGWSL